MKGMLVTADNEFAEVELLSPLSKSAVELLGGSVEHIVPPLLESPYCMIINGESAILGLPENRAGCYLYDTDEHNIPILGDIVILKDVWTVGGIEIAGLEAADIASVTEILEEVFMEVECGQPANTKEKRFD